MNIELSATEQRMLDLLIRHLPKVRPGYAPSYLGYKDVHEALGLEMHGSTYGISLQVQGLESLARHLREIGAPALTGIVIDKTAGWPSHGYFNVHQRPRISCDDQAIRPTSETYLAFRDMATVSVLTGIIIPSIFLIADAPGRIVWIVAAMFSVQYLICAVSARWAGIRFVCNVTR